MANVSRRKLLKGVVAAGVTGTAPLSAHAFAPEDQTATAPAEPDSAAITSADIAALDRITGWTTNSDERRMMAVSLTEKRKSLVALRTSDLAVDREPATRFEPRMPGSTLPTGKSEVRLSHAALPSAGGSVEDLAFFTLTDLSRLLRARKVTSVALTQMYLNRLKRFGPGLLCVISLVDESDALRRAARADAEIADGHYRGPLHGIPYGVKDLLAAKGTRTTFGAKPFANQVWDFDSTVVARLDAAGAILLA